MRHKRRSVVRAAWSASSAIAYQVNEVFVSAASAWEVSTKRRLGRLSGMPRVAARFLDLVNADGFIRLPVDERHALRAGAYRHEHRDPFDRMLAGQAELENLRLVTCDEALSAFGGRRL